MEKHTAKPIQQMEYGCWFVNIMVNHGRLMRKINRDFVLIHNPLSDEWSVDPISLYGDMPYFVPAAVNVCAWPKNVRPHA